MAVRFTDPTRTTLADALISADPSRRLRSLATSPGLLDAVGTLDKAKGAIGVSEAMGMRDVLGTVAVPRALGMRDTKTATRVLDAMGTLDKARGLTTSPTVSGALGILDKASPAIARTLGPLDRFREATESAARDHRASIAAIDAVPAFDFEAIADARAAERGADVNHAKAMVSELAALRASSERAEAREAAASERAEAAERRAAEAQTRSEARERFMVRLTVASVMFGAFSTVGTLIAIFAG